MGDFIKQRQVYKVATATLCRPFLLSILFVTAAFSNIKQRQVYKAAVAVVSVCHRYD